MVLIRRVREDVNFDFVNECVRTYLRQIRGVALTYSEVSELLRHSICVLFDLESRPINERMEQLSKIVVNVLKPVVEKYNMTGKSENYYQGLLEACVHCMELSRKKLGV